MKTKEPNEALEGTRMLVTDHAAHALRQSSVSLSLDVRQANQKPKETHRFSYSPETLNYKNESSIAYEVA